MKIIQLLYKRTAKHSTVINTIRKATPSEIMMTSQYEIENITISPQWMKPLGRMPIPNGKTHPDAPKRNSKDIQ